MRPTVILDDQFGERAQQIRTDVQIIISLMAIAPSHVA